MMAIDAERRNITKSGCFDRVTRFLRSLEISDASKLGEIGLDRCIV
jgi:hypothetical protein